MRALFDTLLALTVSALLYAGTVELFDTTTGSDTTVSAGDFDMYYDQTVDAEVRAQLAIAAPSKGWAIVRYLEQGDAVIAGIYLAIYLTLFIQLRVLLRPTAAAHKIELITSTHVYLATTAGTIGTLYALGSAIGQDMSVTEAIRGSFYDAIYTTLIGLCVSAMHVSSYVLHVQLGKGERCVHA